MFIDVLVSFLFIFFIFFFYRTDKNVMNMFDTQNSLDMHWQNKVCKNHWKIFLSCFEHRNILIPYLVIAKYTLLKLSQDLFEWITYNDLCPYIFVSVWPVLASAFGYSTPRSLMRACPWYALVNMVKQYSKNNFRIAIQPYIDQIAWKHFISTWVYLC